MLVIAVGRVGVGTKEACDLVMALEPHRIARLARTPLVGDREAVGQPRVGHPAVQERLLVAVVDGVAVGVQRVEDRALGLQRGQAPLDRHSGRPRLS